MTTRPKDVCEGFVQLHINGKTDRKLRGRNIHAKGYALYSCGRILATYRSGQFTIAADDETDKTFHRHRDCLLKAVCRESPTLAVDCGDDGMYDEDGFYLGDSFGEKVNAVEGGLH